MQLVPVAEMDLPVVLMMQAAEISNKLAVIKSAAAHQRIHQTCQNALQAVHVAWAKNRACEVSSPTCI